MVQPPSVATIALLVEAVIGYPQALYRLLGHPVGWIGALLGWLDRHANRDTDPFRLRRAAGIATALLVVTVPTACALLVQHAAIAALPRTAAILLLGLIAASLPAQRSLHQHVAAVAAALERDLAAGRMAVAMIVGRDTAALDEPAVARAAIESLAENFSDGVVAPLFWCALFGLPGIVFYKASNTADSMIGHRTARHDAFGWAAARLDDAVNLPASRLSAALIALAAPSRAPAAFRAVLRDAGRHRSPNAGWPEAAMAGALGIRLAGPRAYQGRMVEDHWMGDGTARCGPDDIRRALRLYRRACIGLALVLLGADLLVWRLA